MPVAVKATVHDFRAQLQYSVHAADDSFWERVYREAFPTLADIIDCSRDRAYQRVGIDRKVRLQSGQVLKIDEKKRRKDYGDILLEYVSVDSTGAPGWVEKD